MRASVESDKGNGDFGLHSGELGIVVEVVARKLTRGYGQATSKSTVEMNLFGMLN